MGFVIVHIHTYFLCMLGINSSAENIDFIAHPGPICLTSQHYLTFIFDVELPTLVEPPDRKRRIFLSGWTSHLVGFVDRRKCTVNNSLAQLCNRMLSFEYREIVFAKIVTKEFLALIIHRLKMVRGDGFHYPQGPFEQTAETWPVSSHIFWYESHLPKNSPIRIPFFLSTQTRLLDFKSASS